MSKKELNFGLKLFLSILLIVLCFNMSLGAIMIGVMSSGGVIMYILAPLMFVVAIFSIPFAAIYGKLKKRSTVIFIVSLLVFSIGIMAYKTIKPIYNDKFEQVGNSNLNLADYEPHKSGTKAVTLSEPSKLKIDKDMPVLDGATALYPLYAAFAQAVYPTDENYESRYTYDRPNYMYLYPDNIVNCTNTVNAYRNLMQGQVDIIFVAAPSKEQLEEAKEDGVEFEMTPIGREAFVFFVNGSNHVDSLTTKQIKDIYTGKTKLWKQVGGGFSFIEAFQRIKNSGSQSAMQRFMGDTPLMNPPKDLVFEGMGHILQATGYRNRKNAIGYSFLYYVTEMEKSKNIKLIAIDGVKPTRENVANSTYPIASDFYAVTIKGKESKNTKLFIEWILSKQGQELVAKTGYTPLNSEE